MITELTSWIPFSRNLSPALPAYCLRQLYNIFFQCSSFFYDEKISQNSVTFSGLEAKVQKYVLILIVIYHPIFSQKDQTNLYYHYNGYFLYQNSFIEFSLVDFYFNSTFLHENMYICDICVSFMTHTSGISTEYMLTGISIKVHVVLFFQVWLSSLGKIIETYSWLWNPEAFY